MEPTAAVTPFLGVITSLGSAAAAVFVVYLFIGHLRESARRQEEQNKELTLAFSAVARDKAEVINGVSVALQGNTAAIKHLEETVQRVLVSLEHKKT